jgi:4-carboxymuconolactone decarboxylase
MPAKRPAPRLPEVEEADMNKAQRALLRALREGPRGHSITPRGPFAAWMHAPDLGVLAQALGAYVRYQTSLPPRMSEFVILCTARHWRAQYEWFAHAPIAEREGVPRKVIADIQAGKRPSGATKEELALYDFIEELYKTRRVSDKTYERVYAFLGEEALVQFVGIMGYYALIAMTLNVFNILPPEHAELFFPEPKNG